MNPKEFLSLLAYSSKSFLETMVEILKEFRKPKTWAYLFLIIFFIGLWNRNIKLVTYSIPAIIVIYIIRQKVDGSYRRKKFEKDLINGKDSWMVKEYYESYKKKCKINKILPLSYREWKEREINRYYTS